MAAQPPDDDRTLPPPKPSSPGRPVPASRPGPASQAGGKPQPGDDATVVRADPETQLNADGRTRVRAPLSGGAAPTAPEPQVFAGRFEVVKLLGEGGMGKVYTVRDRQIEGRAVALKVLLPRFSRSEKFRALFFQEIRAAQNFVSEHVVQVRDCGQMDDGRLFVTMDLVDGEALRDVLGREGVLRPRHALEIARQTLLALQSGHEKGFVHRDVKPANIMLAARVSKTDENPYGVSVRVLDFGIAGLAADLDDGKLAGTPMYMSPEQVQGQRLDARSDLFAVGVVLYEMLAGRRPFGGTTVAEITQSVIETNVTPLIEELKDLAAPIRKILEKALQKDREKRYQSASEFITAIEKSSAYKLPTNVPGWAWAALVVCGGGALASGGMLLTGGTRSQQLEDQLAQTREELASARERLSTGVDAAQAEAQRQLNEKIGLLAEKERQITELQNTLDATNKELAGLQTQLAERKASEGDDLTELKARITTQEASMAALTRELDLLKRAKEEAAAEKNNLQQQLTNQQTAQTQLQQQIVELQRERDQLRLQSNPAARRSSKFDDLLGLLERGGGSQAVSVYQQAISDRSFDPPAQLANDLLTQLTEGAEALEKFESSRQGGAIDVQSLLRASRQLGNARNLREGFGVANSDWLSFGLEVERALERPQRLDALLARLGERVQPALESIGSYHADDWAQIEKGGPEQDPQRCVEHATTFGCEHLAALARQAADHARATLERNGQLDDTALTHAAYVTAWGKLLGDGPRPKDAASRELLLYSYAQRWYDADDLNDAGLDLAKVDLPKVTAETADWRAVFALQQELVQTASGFPIRPGRTAVYRYQDGSPLRWRVDDVVAGTNPGSNLAWDIRRSQFREDAMPLGTPLQVRVVRRGSVFSLDGSSDPLLDLKAHGAAVSAAPYPKLFAELPPPQLRVSQSSLNEYRATLEKPIGPCLIFRRGPVTRWFSPTYGLVLEESTAGARLELVFATPLR